jgi:thiamine-phosphate pyrophosphorylase
MVGGGIDMIQYRAKAIDGIGMRADITEILSVTGSKIPVIVNDDPQLTFETGAAGVHLGASDAPPRTARSLLGPHAIIGVTVHTFEEFERAPRDEIDYAAVGAIFPSPTKPDVAVSGLDLVRRCAAAGGVAVVAIGGITPSNIGGVFEAGAAGAAVASALFEGDLADTCASFARAVAQWNSSG